MQITIVVKNALNVNNSGKIKQKTPQKNAPNAVPTIGIITIR